MSSHVPQHGRLKPLGLFHVEYIEWDLLGYVMAWASLLPMAILACYATLIYFRRDLNVIFLLCAQLMNEFLNYCLKNIIKQERPDRALPYRVKHVSGHYGMPSQHAQFMSFCCTYVCLLTLWKTFQRLTPKADSKNRVMTAMLYIGSLSIWVVLRIVGILICWILCCYSRVYLQYHTWAQVIGGICIGSLLGAMAFLVAIFKVQPNAFDIVNSPIMKFFMVRNDFNVYDTLMFEYGLYLQAARVRNSGHH